ncbi:nuclear pore complex protein isoform X2 [Wolffia australiana]
MDEDRASSSPEYFDPRDLSGREQYRRYRKRLSSSPSSLLRLKSGSKFSDTWLLYDDNSILRRPNAALFLEEIKHEALNDEPDVFEGEFRAPDSSKRRNSGDARVSPSHVSESAYPGPPLGSIKQEDDGSVDTGEDATFSMFASLLDSALQGLLPFADLILRFKSTCGDVFESIRYGGIGRHRAVENKLMQQKARLLLDEAATWSLLWYLFGKGNDDIPVDLILSPSTSHQEACQYVVNDMTAQLCLRIVQWLEGLTSETLDLEKKVKGSHVGSYLPSSGVWHHTQQYLRRKNHGQTIVQHLDFDAPTREAGQLHLDDRKQEESLLEDVWILLRAGRVPEACDLCRSAGQAWRAATLCPFGGVELAPSVEALQKNGKSRVLQAIELESDIGRQWRLWKWASYCASEKIAEQDGRYEAAVYAAQCSNLKRMLPVCADWESACWALAKSWLDVQVDQQLSQFRQVRSEQMRNYGVDGNSFPEEGLTPQSLVDSESWPQHVIDQQPRDLSSLLQKLHSSDIVHEAVSKACKEHHRQIEMNLMTGDIPNLLDVLWSWISPAKDFQNIMRPQCDPQLIRFSAHFVLVLRYLFPDEMKDTFRNKLTTVGDYILHVYALFLFSKQHEELVGVYAAQLAPHLCIDLFVHMMEEKLNDSFHTKHKIFLSAIRYLSFCSEEDSKASFEDIIERVLIRSRGTKIKRYDGEQPSDVAEQHRLQSLEKANAVQWLCFTPPSTIPDFTVVNAKLLMRALCHSNILFREFALISLWRIPKMPIGAHKLLSFLAELLKQPMHTLLSLDKEVVAENLHEFEDWREYYSCDATYRNWLKMELENADVPPTDLSLEEKERAVDAANEAIAASLSLLERKDGVPWLTCTETSECEASEPVYIELNATAMLCLPSGECLLPDPASCTTLTSALYACISEGDVLKRQVMISVAICSKDSYCVEVTLRCLAVAGDGLGFHGANDGGILAATITAAFKGELSRFQAGVTLEISRLDAWFSDCDGSLRSPATYIVRGLCRRCCLPELILRSMQILLALAETGESVEDHDRLIELVASDASGLHRLFSQRQLQEFLVFERDFTLYRMEAAEA